MPKKGNQLHIVTAVAVIRNQDGKYLVLKRHSAEKTFPGVYTLPGGKVEGNDTIEETLSKEVMEESGLTLKGGKIFLKDKTFVRHDRQTTKVFSYLCQIKNGQQVCISREFSDFRWVHKKDLKHIPHFGIEEDLQRAEWLYRSGLPRKYFHTKSVKEKSSTAKKNAHLLGKK